MMGAGLALVLLWALLGNDIELLLTGAFLTTAAVIGVIWVRLTGLALTVERRISPGTVNEGQTVTAAITVRNAGRIRIANLFVVDEIRGLGLASFETSLLRSGDSATGTYRVSCRPRGIYQVGPPKATATDPLGLAEVSVVADLVDRLVVYPAVEDLDGLPSLAARTGLGNQSTPDRSQRGGEDFYTLRQYQLGDDLRRVHWPWSAKTEELMIRQLQTPQHAEAVIYLDTRANAYESGDAFEQAVRGAASALAHLARFGLATEVWFGGSESSGEKTYRGAMEQLAVITPRWHIHLAPSAAQLEDMVTDGVLVVVTGTPDREVLTIIRALGSRRAFPIAMLATGTTPPILGQFHREGIMTIVSSEDGSWAREWRRTTQGSWDAASAR